MPTRRTPRHHGGHRPRITGEWADRFRRLCELSPVRTACHHGNCRSQRVGELCKACLERREVHLTLQLHFGWPPWKTLDESFKAPRGLSAEEAARWWASALEYALVKTEHPNPFRDQ